MWHFLLHLIMSSYWRDETQTFNMMMIFFPLVCQPFQIAKHNISFQIYRKLQLINIKWTNIIIEVVSKNQTVWLI